MFAIQPLSLCVCKWRMLARLRRTSDLCTHGQIAPFVAELGSGLPRKFPALQNSQCQSPRALGNKSSPSLCHLHPPGTEGGTGRSWSPGLAVTNFIFWNLPSSPGGTMLALERTQRHVQSTPGPQLISGELLFTARRNPSPAALPFPQKVLPAAGLL